MRIFLDTNVILDIALRRPTFETESRQVLLICCKPENTGSVAWHSLSNTYYVLAKAIGRAAADQFLLELLSLVEVGPASNSLADKAFRSGFKDSEDALQFVVAEAVGADVIVTRNPVDFSASTILVRTPAEFVQS